MHLSGHLTWEEGRGVKRSDWGEDPSTLVPTLVMCSVMAQIFSRILLDEKCVKPGHLFHYSRCNFYQFSLVILSRLCKKFNLEYKSSLAFEVEI